METATWKIEGSTEGNEYWEYTGTYETARMWTHQNAPGATITRA